MGGAGPLGPAASLAELYRAITGPGFGDAHPELIEMAVAFALSQPTAPDGLARQGGGPGAAGGAGGDVRREPRLLQGLRPGPSGAAGPERAMPPAMADARDGGMSGLAWVAIVLVIIGALNWGLVGLFNFNLVAAIFGSLSALSRIIYVLVAASGLYLIYLSTRLVQRPR